MYMNNLITNVLTLGGGSTRVRYTQASGLAEWEGDIVGSIDGRDVGPWYTTQIPNAPDIESLSIGNDVTALGFNAFADCFGLLHATIPNSVTTLAEAAFANCKNLESIVIPNSVTSIGPRAFMSCENLISATISNNLASIPSSMFALCLKLPNITIPEGMTSIGNSAFWGCNVLENITFPNSIRYIEIYAFYACGTKIENGTKFDFRRSTSVPTLANVNAFGTNASSSNREIIVPDSLYDTWKSTSRWNSTTNNIVNSIVKASQSSLGTL